MTGIFNYWRQLLANIKAYWNRSIRRQLMLSFSLLALTMMLGFSALMLTHQRSFLYEATNDRATGLAHALASSSASWVLSNDLAGLQEVLTGFSNTTDLKFAMVLSLKGEVLAGTEISQIGRYVNDKISLDLLSSAAEPKMLINQPSLVDVALPIMAGNRHIGWARVEMTRHSALSNLKLIGLAGLGFSILAVISALLVANILAKRLTRHLHHLILITTSIEQGRRNVRSTIKRNDEVGQLALSFNNMLNTLVDSETMLEHINRLYAAWTECNKIIAQQDDADKLRNSICKILAQQVPFELVWIGVPDQDGWIHPVARSGAGADHLIVFKRSTDPSLAEGHFPISIAIRNGCPEIFNDFLATPEAMLWGGLAEQLNLRSVAAFPIFIGNQCYGGIAVHSSKVNFFTPELISLMSSIANDISLALNKLELEKQRRDAEKALSDSEFRWKFAIEGAGDGLWDWNIAEQKVTFSKRWKELIGYAEYEIKDQFEEFESRLYPEDREHVLNEIKNYFENRIPNYNVEFRFQCKDGSYKWILARGMAVNRDEKGMPLRMIGTHTDITERKHTESELSIAAIAFESQEGMIVTDADNHILRVNRAFSNITGYSAEEVIGKNPHILSSGQHDPSFYSAMWEDVKNKGAWEGEIWNKRKNNEIFPEYLTISTVRNASGQVTNYVATLSDITDRKLAEEEIETLAFYDSLTGLPNRRLLLDRLNHALTTSSRNGKDGALLFLDLDHFKMLNDTLGHATGDLLLQQVAERLTTCVREEDTVARLGGDEFVIMLESLSESALDAAAQAEAIGEKILNRIRQPYQLGSHKHQTGVSIGVALFSGHNQSQDELLKHADIAMYQAKKANRNTMRFYDPQMQASIDARAALEADLRIALQEKQLKLYYQPQVYHNGNITGAEALLRWEHPTRGLISPLEFIPLAEDTGLILPIGQWVLDTACHLLKTWEANIHTRNLQLAVNVSAKQFHQTDFVEQVRQTILRNQINPDKLKLELTESLVLDNIAETNLKMHALREIGVRFSMDDFGTGYSSLAYLTQLPLDQLKIDQSFIRNIGIKPTDAVIVQTIIGMGNSLGMEVIAEGVETEVQRAFLQLHGCPICQGYLFSKPVPLETFETLLQQATCKQA